MRASTTLLLAAALIGVSGCKERATEAALKDDEAPGKRVLLVGFGGWNSCRLQSHPLELPTPTGFVADGLSELSKVLTPKHSFTFAQLNHLAKTLEASGVDVTWMSACFSLGLPSENSIWTLRSDGALRAYPTLEVSAAIREYAGTRDIMLIGHSYGGWMSAVVSGQLGRPVLGTFTLEAISGEKCPTYAAAFGTAAKYPYCQRAPDDGAVDLAAALANTTRWVNVHLPAEGRDVEIYSGPYKSPVQNHALPYQSINSGPFGNAHHMLGLGKRTWDLICTNASELLGVSASCNAIEVDSWGAPR